MDKIDLRCVGGPFSGQFFEVPQLKHGDSVTLYEGGAAPNPTEYTAFEFLFRGPVSAIRGKMMVLVHTDVQASGPPLMDVLDSIKGLLERDISSMWLEVLARSE